VGAIDPDLMVAGAGGDGDAELVACGVSGGFPGVMVLVEFVPESPWSCLHGDEAVGVQCLVGPRAVAGEVVAGEVIAGQLGGRQRRGGALTVSVSANGALKQGEGVRGYSLCRARDLPCGCGATPSRLRRVG
jgi:hypothetical protein